MIRMKQPVILNSKGQPYRLTPAEQYHAEYMQRVVNERFANQLGYEVSITTLTTIVKKISEQKFFELPPADYIPVRVGEGAFSSTLLTYRSFATGDAFSSGIINTGGNNARLAKTDAAVDAVPIAVKNWAKENEWTIFDLELAARSGNWDIVSAKEKSRKKNWDLGIQEIAFLGLAGDSSVLGLLTQSGITTNTTRITSPISGLSTTDLKSFCSGVYEDYRANCNRTAKPNRFAVPESDFNGLASQSSPDFPIKSVLEVLEETFKLITGRKDFKVLSNAYGDPAYNLNFINVGTGKHAYALYNSEEESIRMDIPVDYTNTLANSLNNFQFQNVAYGQFTGVMAYRPQELLYYQY